MKGKTSISKPLGFAEENRGLGCMASCDEQPAHAAIAPDVREFIISKLAEILVLDLQTYPKVPAPTVVEGRVSNRTSRRVKRRTN